MFRAFGPELSVRLLLVGLLIAGVPSAGYAEIGEPPDPATENLLGPATVGTATITPIGDGSTINVQFAGHCGSSGVAFNSPSNLAFSLVTAANLVDTRLGSIAIFGPACYAGLVGDLIINTVTSFTANDTNGDGQVDQIITDLVILAVVPRP